MSKFFFLLALNSYKRMSPYKAIPLKGCLRPPKMFSRYINLALTSSSKCLSDRRHGWCPSVSCIAAYMYVARYRTHTHAEYLRILREGASSNRSSRWNETENVRPASAIPSFLETLERNDTETPHQVFSSFRLLIAIHVGPQMASPSSNCLIYLLRTSLAVLVDSR